MPALTRPEAMRRIDTLLSHVWMVRTFLKHCEEAEEDEEVRNVHRALYDFMLALGAPFKAGDDETYLKTCRKKLSKLKRANELFQDIQPEVSSHTNFQRAAQSLDALVKEISEVVKCCP